MSVVQQVAETLQRGNNCLLSGLDGSCKTYVISQLVQSLGRKLVYMTGEIEQAYDAARSLRGILGNDAVKVLPPKNYIARESEAYSHDSLERMTFFSEILEHPRKTEVLVMSAPSLLFETIDPDLYRASAIRLTTGDAVDVNELLARLVDSGYRRQALVEGPGQFSVRGGIIDIFPVRMSEPVRVELFGDEIESLRHFAPDTQRSTGKLKSVNIWPVREVAGKGGRAWQYLAGDWPLWIDDLAQFRESWLTHLRRYRTFLRQTRSETEVERFKVFEWDEFECELRRRPAVYHSFFAKSLPVEIPVHLRQHIAQHECEPLWVKPHQLPQSIQEWRSRGWKVTLAIPEKKVQDHIRRDLEESMVTGGYEFVRWRLEQGFVSSTLGEVLVTEKELGRKRRSRYHKAARSSGVGLSELAVGDYVVHEHHGIGIFQGVSQQEIDGIKKEYLTIQYAGTDRLYLPIDKLDLLTKYTGGGEPRLNRLGGSEWERTKKRVQSSIREMARELLELYSAREKMRGFAFTPDNPWQKEFDEGFEFEETPDQARAIREVFSDMEKPRPMDRLVCGDVGYGKTEVAMRAAFKAIMDRKQVAVLVPTTILAEQHYRTFTKRFAPYPAVIEILSRFRTPSQQKRVIEDLRRGVVDIVIGTHRLLSRDVQFRDLGLLIIDEEHRFGVRQKERIKTLARTVDVISLTATPIPRTLHMALTGLRDLSVIETPPPERYPINTYVMEYNPELVREAILAEVGRGGQVFYLHNRINNMEKVRQELEAMLPGLSIDMAHGRMEEKELAAVMNRFMDGKTNVLLCTTIIESGLDMPNVNTLIVDEADRLGLAQLYQIRGRIGRSNRVAYAYLTYRPDRSITETAQKRLNAIREFTELGSGMRIALRDLEIRGAGNILGPEQHGYIEAVGFDLYCRLLEEETARTRGETPVRPEMPQLDIKVDSYIPDSYIEDPGLKIQVYRQAMMAATPAEITEIEKSLQDRFGPPPPPVQNLLRISRLRLKARDKSIKHINTDNRQIELTLDSPLGTRAEGLVGLQQKYGFKISVTNQNTLVLKSGRGITLDMLEDLLGVI
ncbi:MAG: transcription-repair coupling factor [Syntrophomonadaceae bacterium]|nr:transcription-repair coupling factor [Syntrophomonadaceae bacterium]